MKTFDDLKREVKTLMDSQCFSNENEFMVWYATQFTLSRDKRFVAYIVRSLYEKSRPSQEIQSNKIVVYDLEKEREISSEMNEYLVIKGGFQIKRPISLRIKYIQKVLNDGEVKFTTDDNILHTLKFYY